MSRPSVSPGLLAEIVDGVPSRLKRKLDKNPTLAEGWSWTAVGEWIEVQASEDVVVTARATGVRDADDLRCGCLLAPRCLHRLAVARALPLEEAAATEATPTAEPAAPAAETSALTPKERVATAAAKAALEALIGTGTEGAGVRIEGGLLNAVHLCRGAGLHRLSSGLVRLVTHLRRRGPDRDPAAAAALVRDALGLARTLTEADEAGIEERGWGRRPYHPIAPVALYGVVSAPFSTDVGYSGITTFVVDRAGTLSSFSHVIPEGGKGLSDQTPLLAGASVTHRDASRHQVLLEGGTRSPDGRLGTGSKVKTVLGAPVDWWSEPVANLFDAPLGAQLSRVFAARARPPHLRSEGADLLFVHGVADGEGRFLVDGRALPLTARAHATEQERADIANLGRARGVSVRMVARAGVQPELVPMAFATEGEAPWIVGRGGERNIEDAWGKGGEVPRAAPPAPTSTEAWQPLQRVLVGVMRLGWRAVSASRRERAREEALRLGEAGFKGADALVNHLIECGAHDGLVSRRPDLSAFGTGWWAASMYLAHLDAWAEERAWGTDTLDT